MRFSLAADEWLNVVPSDGIFLGCFIAEEKEFLVIEIIFSTSGLKALIWRGLFCVVECAPHNEVLV